jgi:hypothetical protein
VTGATAACCQTFTKRCKAVIVVNTNMIHMIGINNGGNSSPRHKQMIRSARSINPPLAESPKDSALARSYEITELIPETAKGNIAK